MTPRDFPVWTAVYQQYRRWLAAGCFVRIAAHLRKLLRTSAGRNPHPTVAIFDGRVVQSTPESGSRAAYNGHKKIKGSKTHLAVDTFGYPLAKAVTPADENERSQVDQLSKDVQAATEQNVKIAFADQGYTGPYPAADAKKHGIDLQIVQRTKDAAGPLISPKRWVVERSFAWMTRYRRLVRDYERLPEVHAGLCFVAFITIMLARLRL